MKKCPKALTLVLMTSLTLGSAGCSTETQEDDFRVFNTVGECVSSNAYTKEDCEEMFAAAVTQTPRFSSQSECEEQFGVGNCGTPETLSDQPGKTVALLEGAQSGVAQAGAGETGASQSESGEVKQESRGSWMPIMMGYMMGRYMSGGSAFKGSQPLYKAPSGTTGFRTPTGDMVRPDSSGRVSNPGSSIRKGFASTAKPTTARSGAASRGGFGGKSGFGSAGS